MIARVGPCEVEARRQVCRIGRTVEQREQDAAPGGIRQCPSKPIHGFEPVRKRQHALNSTVTADQSAREAGSDPWRTRNRSSFGTARPARAGSTTRSATPRCCNRSAIASSRPCARRAANAYSTSAAATATCQSVQREKSHRMARSPVSTSPFRCWPTRRADAAGVSNVQFQQGVRGIGLARCVVRRRVQSIRCHVLRGPHRGVHEHGALAEFAYGRLSVRVLA